MKICPICNQTYSDDSLNFCLNDGSTLTKTSENPPPTIVMDSPRRTNPNYVPFETGFGAANQQIYQQPVSAPARFQSQDQTLPVISLILGIISMTMICCYGFGGIFGIGALITGFVGMNKTTKDPMRYGGRGLAIAGLVMGGFSILLSLAWIIWILIIIGTS